MSAPIIILEVSMSETGAISSRLRPCSLSTKDYGKLLASLVRQLAHMMAVEGRFDEGIIYSQILLFMGDEIGADDEGDKPSLLQ